jgi:hypothetical protein
VPFFASAATWGLRWSAADLIAVNRLLIGNECDLIALLSVEIFVP